MTGSLRGVDYVLGRGDNTYMSKLTLSVDERVVKQAKRYAARHGVSVSQLVERFLGILTRPPRASLESPPALKMLDGS